MYYLCLKTDAFTELWLKWILKQAFDKIIPMTNLNKTEIAVQHTAENIKNLP